MIALNVPASNGVGAAGFVGDLDPAKTFVVGGTLAVGETLIVEGTSDDAGVAGWNGLVTFNASGSTSPLAQGNGTAPTNSQFLNTIAITAVVQWLRVRRQSTLTSNAAPTLTVDATALATSEFWELAVPTGVGVGAPTFISDGMSLLQATVSGVFANGESLVLEASQDGTTWDSLQAFTNNYPAAQLFQDVRYEEARVRRLAAGSGTLRMFLGTSNPVGGVGLVYNAISPIVKVGATRFGIQSSAPNPLELTTRRDGYFSKDQAAELSVIANMNPFVTQLTATEIFSGTFPPFDYFQSALMQTFFCIVDAAVAGSYPFLPQTGAFNGDFYYYPVKNFVIIPELTTGACTLMPVGKAGNNVGNTNLGSGNLFGNIGDWAACAAAGIGTTYRSDTGVVPPAGVSTLRVGSSGTPFEFVITTPGNFAGFSNTKVYFCTSGFLMPNIIMTPPLFGH